MSRKKKKTIQEMEASAGRPDRLPAVGDVHEFTLEEAQEFLRCKNDPVYFLKKYMKIINVDRGLIPFEMYDFQEKMIRSYHANRFNITMCSRQVGKACRIDTNILTASGWKQLKDVHPGDQVYTPNGTLSTVTGESPIHYNRDVYRMRFDTTDEVVCDGEHLWTVEVQVRRQRGHGRKTRQLYSTYETRTLTTNELIKEKQVPSRRIRIRCTEPLQFPTSSTPLPMDPYLFGLWLGDGYSASPYLIGMREDVDFYESQVGVPFGNLTERRPHIRLVKFGVCSTLKSMGVYQNKHIPESYLRASVKDRLSVLQGLMDTDGNSNGRGGCQFYQKMDSALMPTVRALLWGLGIKHRLKIKTVNGKQYGTLQFSTDLTVFRLPRKVALHTQRAKSGDTENDRENHEKAHYWYLTDIIPTESVPVKCIVIDDPEHLFLCGDQLIPTHNSTTVVGFFLHYILFNLNVRVCISANKQKIAADLLQKLKLAYEHLPRFLQQGVEAWAKLEIKLANGSSAFAAATSSSAVRGGSYNAILLDEFAFVPSNIANEFYASTYPTITSGTTTKIIMVSTPNGMNLFHRFWKGAQSQRNDFVPIFVHWSEVPGRDEKWKETTIRNIGGPEKFAQEYECFPAGTLVQTIRGAVPIEQLRVGESVLTHRGRWRPITNTMQKSFAGDLIKITAFGSGSIEMTPEHPVLVYEKSNQSRRWKPAKDVVIGDYVVTPKFLSGPQVLSDDWVSLIGWFICEGSVNGNAVYFSLNPKNILEQDEVRSVLVRLGYSSKWNGSSLVVNDTRLADKLVAWCGSGAENKHIPFDVITGKESLLFDVLMRGDGCRISRGWTYTTVSKSLAHDVFQLSASLGRRAGIVVRPAREGIILQRQVSMRESYCIQISKGVTVNHSRVRDAFPTKYGMVYRVKDIQHVPFAGTVYNLSVKFDESYVANGRAVHNCSFLSTAFTLINSTVLERMVYTEPIDTTEDGSYMEYDPPDEERTYLMLADVAEGKEQDASTFTIIDMTELPYRVVASYNNNKVSIMEFPAVIAKYAARYFNPWLMIEVMDLGRDVAFVLSRDFEYPRLMTTASEKRLGQRLVFNSNPKRHLGLRMSSSVKRSGCAVLKTLVENDQLILNDYRIIEQLGTFIQRGATYGAEVNFHDDLVTPLVMLGWASLQPNFTEITEIRALDTYTKLPKFTPENPVPASIPRVETPMPFGIMGFENDEDDAFWLIR